MKAINLTKTECNVIYNNMYQRCYNEKIHEKKPYYKDCTMCDEWLEDKYSFYDWVNDGNFYEIEGEKTVHLDKDILVKGNKLYSPETCVFAPASINELIGGTSNKQTDESLPSGVTRTKNGKYKPKIKGFQDVFDTPDEAWSIYAAHTKAKIITMADQYVGKIPYKLYYALLDWKMEITD